MSEELDARMAERERVMDLIGPQLGGLEYAIQFPTKPAASVAVAQLMSCREHRGVHHFVVVGEGRIVAFSTSGHDCLLAAGIL